MSIGTVIDSLRVKPFEIDAGYSSRMLLDRSNSESTGININEGILKAGHRLPGGVHEGHDEIYYILEGRGILHMDGTDYPMSKGTVVYIPGGTFHALDNSLGTEDMIVMTIWPKHPAKGANEVYDLRIKVWGKSFQYMDGKEEQ